MRLRRPVLRYHGGKHRIAPWICSHFPAHRVYVEPFGGAASVLLHKPRSVAEVYNDLDGDVVNVFRVLRDAAAAEDLRRRCELTPFARQEFELSYEPTEDPVERARRTIVRGFFGHGSSSRMKHRTGFRGKAFRRNQTGATDWANWPAEIPAFVERFRGVIIESREARELLGKNDSGETLFYLDPPYPHATRSSIRGPWDVGRAYAHELTDEEHVELARDLRALRGAVVLSGYRGELYDGLYSDWASRERATVGDGGVHRTEVLWLNEAAERGGLLF